jgi:hypothetical protein
MRDAFRVIEVGDRVRTRTGKYSKALRCRVGTVVGTRKERWLTLFAVEFIGSISKRRLVLEYTGLELDLVRRKGNGET